MGTANLLSCDEFRNFWLDWSGSTVTFGSGDYRGHIVLSYTNENETYDVVSLSLSTYYTFDGQWSFLQDKG